MDCYASEVVFKLIDARENSPTNSGTARRRRRPTTQDAKPRYAAATGAAAAEQPPPRVHSPGNPPLPALSSGYIIGNLRLLSRLTV